MLAVALDTAVQLAWKLSAAHGEFAQMLTSPWFAVTMAMLSVQFWNWLRVLGSADLSFAQPITALSYVTVLALSFLWLHERISLRQDAGVALILAGVWFISRTPHLSQGPRRESEPK